MQLTDSDSRVLKSLGVQWDEPTARLVDQLEAERDQYRTAAENWATLAGEHFYAERGWRMAFWTLSAVCMILGAVCYWVLR